MDIFEFVAGHVVVQGLDMIWVACDTRAHWYRMRNSKEAERCHRHYDSEGGGTSFQSGLRMVLHMNTVSSH